MGKMSLLSRSFVYAVAVSSLTAFGCGSPGAEEGEYAVSQARLAEFDGVELFRGLVLMYGEVGDQVPEIREHFSLSNLEMSEEQRREITGSHDRLIEAIHEVDPEFFVRFEENVRSGEHVLVDKALDEGSRMLLTAARYAGGRESFEKFFEEYGDLSDLDREYLPENYEGRLHPDLVEFIKGKLLTVDGRVPEIPERFSRFDRGLGLDVSYKVNWFYERNLHIKYAWHIKRAVTIPNNPPWDDWLDPNEFQLVIREKLIDSVVQVFRH